MAKKVLAFLRFCHAQFRHPRVDDKDKFKISPPKKSGEEATGFTIVLHNENVSSKMSLGRREGVPFCTGTWEKKTEPDFLFSKTFHRINIVQVFVAKE